MNRFNIIWISSLFFAMISFPACSDEQPVEKTDGGTVFSLILSSSPKKTKSDASLATQSELQISNYAVSVFDTNGARLDYRGGTLDDGSDNCKIEGLKSQVGEVRIVAVANAGADGFSSYVDYSGLEAVTVGTPSQLVKVGTEVVKITKNNETVEIGLTQLAARVDFKVEVSPENGSGWRYEIKDVMVYNCNMASDLVIDGYNKQKELQNLSFKAEEAISFYTYERKPDDSDPIVIRVNGILKDNGQSGLEINKSYSLTLNPKKTDDGSVKGDGLLHGNRYEVTGTIRPKSAFIIEWKILERENIEVDVPVFE